MRALRTEIWLGKGNKDWKMCQKMGEQRLYKTAKMKGTLRIRLIG